MKIQDIDRRTVCIVTLDDTTVNPAVLLQVTIEPTNVSPSGQLIRFGAQGDEIVGWKRIDKIQIVEVLGWPNKHGMIEPAPSLAAKVQALSAA